MQTKRKYISLIFQTAIGLILFVTAAISNAETVPLKGLGQDGFVETASTKPLRADVKKEPV